MSALWAKFEIFLRKFCFFSRHFEQKARKFAGLSCLYLAFLIGKRNLVRALHKSTLFLQNYVFR